MGFDGGERERGLGEREEEREEAREEGRERGRGDRGRVVELVTPVSPVMLPIDSREAKEAVSLSVKSS